MRITSLATGIALGVTGFFATGCSKNTPTPVTNPPDSNSTARTLAQRVNKFLARLNGGDTTGNTSYQGYAYKDSTAGENDSLYLNKALSSDSVKVFDGSAIQTFLPVNDTFNLRHEYRLDIAGNVMKTELSSPLGGSLAIASKDIFKPGSNINQTLMYNLAGVKTAIWENVGNGTIRITHLLNSANEVLTDFRFLK